MSAILAGRFPSVQHDITAAFLVDVLCEGQEAVLTISELSSLGTIGVRCSFGHSLLVSWLNLDGFLNFESALQT